MKLLLPAITLSAFLCVTFAQGEAVHHSNTRENNESSNRLRALKASTGQRDLQTVEVDTELLIQALAQGIPSIIGTSFGSILDLAITLVTNPAGFLEALTEAIANIVSSVVTVLINMAAASLPETISSVIVSVLTSVDPMDLPTFLAEAEPLGDACAFNFTVSSAKLEGLKTAEVGGVVVTNPIIDNSVITAGVIGSFSFSSLVWTFGGELTTFDLSCENSTYTAVATMDKPSFDLDVGFTGEITFNSTTNTDWISFTAVDINNFALSGFKDYVWTSNDGPEELKDALAPNIDEYIEMAEDSTEDPNGLLESSGFELPYAIDSTMDIPILG